mmetsp:Transcript_16886/g.38622  ORF Transcript_16886/g.38622 Transcript_16886/m.38622 type:complete len:249 (+) Transcript_16886:1191-1937(+)
MRASAAFILETLGLKSSSRTSPSSARMTSRPAPPTPCTSTSSSSVKLERTKTCERTCASEVGVKKRGPTRPSELAGSTTTPRDESGTWKAEGVSVALRITSMDSLCPRCLVHWTSASSRASVASTSSWSTSCTQMGWSARFCSVTYACCAVPTWTSPKLSGASVTMVGHASVARAMSLAFSTSSVTTLIEARSSVAPASLRMVHRLRRAASASTSLGSSGELGSAGFILFPSPSSRMFSERLPREASK